MKGYLCKCVAAVLLSATGVVADERFDRAENAVRSALSAWNSVSSSQIDIGPLVVTLDGDTPVLTGQGDALGLPVSLESRLGGAGFSPETVVLEFEDGVGLPLDALRALHPDIAQLVPQGVEDLAELEEVALSLDAPRGTVTEATIVFGGDNWQPVPGLDVTVGPFSFEATLSDPMAGGDAGVTAVVAGATSLLGVDAAITGNLGSSRDDWELTARVANLTLDRLLAFAAEPGDAILAALPAPLRSLGLTEGEVTLHPADRMVTVSSNSSFGQVQGGVTLRGAKRFYIGIQPPQGFTFASLDPGLRTLDDIQLQNTALILTSHAQNVALPLLEAYNGTRVGSGLTVLAAWRIDQLHANLAKIMGRTDLVVQATIGTSLNKMELQAALNTNLSIDPGGVLQLKNAYVTLRPDPTQAIIKLGGVLQIQVDQQQALQFDGGLIVDITDQGLEAEGGLINTWQDPLGIAGLAIGPAQIGGGLSFRTTPFPLPSFRVRGGLAIGDATRPDFKGDGFVALDTANPIQSAMDFGFNQLDFDQIMRAALAPATYRSIPSDIRNTVLQTRMQDVRLTVVPSPSGVTAFGQSYDPGFLVQGSGSIAGQTGEILMALDYTAGIEAKATVGRIVHPPFFSLTGAGGRGDPLIYVIAKPAQRSMVAITGRASVLGVTSETDVHINDRGFRFYTRGQIFDAFNAQIEVAGGDLSNGGTIYAMAHMQNDLTSRITRIASEAIAEATRQTRRDMGKARDEIDRARREVARLEGVIVAQRRIVRQERARDCAGIAFAEGEVAKAQREVNRLQGKINRLHRLINNNKDQWWNVPGWGAEIAVLETAKGTAFAGLEAARLVLGGIKEGCNTVPVDLDPRVAGPIVAKETANGVLIATRETLRGLEEIGVGTLSAAQWINQNANPLGVVNITNARFEGCLNAMDGGFVSMEVRGTFADQPIDGAFVMNLRSPDAAIRDFAATLLNRNRAPQDYRRRGSCARPADMGQFVRQGGTRLPSPASQVSLLP